MSGWKEIKASMHAWFDRNVVSPVVAEAETQLVDQVREETRRRLDAELQDLHAHRRADGRRFDELGEEIRTIEERTTQQLEDHARRMAAMVARSSGELSEELFAALADSDLALRAEIAKERRQRTDETKRLSDTVVELADTAQRARDEATRRVDQALRRRELIAGLPHDKFAPGRLDRVDRRLEAVQEDLARGYSQTVLADLRGVAEDLEDLRTDVDNRRSEWVVLRAKALNDLSLLGLRIDANERSFVVDRSGQRLAEAQFEVDQWSDGGLGQLRVALADAAGRAESPDVTLDELRLIIAEELPKLKGELRLVLQDAQHRVVASQLRANIADVVAEVLQERFAYREQRWTYRDGDERQAVIAVLELGGNEIVVEVAPSHDPIDNQLRLYSLDTTNASRERRQDRLSEVYQELQDRGVEVGSVQEGPEQARDVVMRLFGEADASAARSRARGTAGPGRGVDLTASDGAGISDPPSAFGASG